MTMRRVLLLDRLLAPCLSKKRTRLKDEILFSSGWQGQRKPTLERNATPILKIGLYTLFP